MARLSTDTIWEILLEKPSIVGFIGIRGSGKTHSATYFLEEGVEEGWRVVLMDTRGEDFGIHKPNVFLAGILAKYGIEPKGYEGRFFTFKWLRRMHQIPAHYELAPISLKMLEPEDLKVLKPTISDHDIELLGEALEAAGGPESATLDGLIYELANMSSNISFRLINFLANGILDDTSPLEAEKLLESDKPFTVLSAGFSGIRMIPVQLFGFRVTAFNLLDYIATHSVYERVMIWFRELRPIAPRAKQKRAQWHTVDLLEQMILSYRELSGTLTRIGYEAQYPRLIPPVFLKQAELLFISPSILLMEKEVKDLNNNFGDGIPDSVFKDLSARKPKPGLFYAVTKEGDWDILYIPPSRSFRRIQPRKKEEKEVVRRITEATISFRTLEEEKRQVRARFIELRSLIRGDVEAPPKQPQQREERISISERTVLSLPIYVSLLVYLAYKKAIERGWEEDGSIVIYRDEISSDAREVGLQDYVSRVRLQKMLRKRRNRRFLKAVGFIIHQDGMDFYFELTPRFMKLFGPKIADIIDGYGGYKEFYEVRKVAKSV